jgi:hypothetical protein
VPHFDERLRCCQIHIGLDNMVYSAFTGNLTQLVQTIEHTSKIASND